MQNEQLGDSPSPEVIAQVLADRPRWAVTDYRQKMLSRFSSSAESTSPETK